MGNTGANIEKELTSELGLGEFGRRAPELRAGKESFNEVPPLPGRLTPDRVMLLSDAPPPGAWAFIDSERPESWALPLAGKTFPGKPRPLEIIDCPPGKIVEGKGSRGPDTPPLKFWEVIEVLSEDIIKFGEAQICGYLKG